MHLGIISAYPEYGGVLISGVQISEVPLYPLVVIMQIWICIVNSSCAILKYKALDQVVVYQVGNQLQQKLKMYDTQYTMFQLQCHQMQDALYIIHVSAPNNHKFMMILLAWQMTFKHFDKLFHYICLSCLHVLNHIKLLLVIIYVQSLKI